ncbi:MAG: hypothetical protein MJ119_03815 [Lachnospiraceae bacterium]|nr:hypothetical protein [Lachnospiraceae bacterium]
MSTIIVTPEWLIQKAGEINAKMEMINSVFNTLYGEVKDLKGFSAQSIDAFLERTEYSESTYIVFANYSTLFSRILINVAEKFDETDRDTSQKTFPIDSSSSHLSEGIRNGIKGAFSIDKP